MTIQQAMKKIKNSIERAIRSNGYDGKNNLIRSQKPIKIIHNVIVSNLISSGINISQIKDELTLFGSLKKKSQDICVLPQNIKPIKEIINSGYLCGEEDEFGKDYTEKILSINIRSQLSSLAKNFDTLYERTFAEALNLHIRCPKMVLGELYMIPVFEYDSNSAKNNKVKFIKKIGNVEKYLLAFELLNNRTSIQNDFYKYERICMLIVNFSKKEPKIYNSDEELKRDGFLPENSKASIKNLNFETFIPSLLEIYNKRINQV